MYLINQINIDRYSISDNNIQQFLNPLSHVTFYRNLARLNWFILLTQND